MRFGSLPPPIDLLKQLINIPSVASPPHYEVPLAETVEDHLQCVGFTVTRQDVQFPHKPGQKTRRYNLLAERGQGGRLDTEREIGWQPNPHPASHIADCVYGSGAFGTKAGLAAILCAAEVAQPKAHKLKLAFLVDECETMLGAQTLSRSPWLEDVRAAIVPEPHTNGVNANGVDTLALGRRGRFTVQVVVAGCQPDLSAQGTDMLLTTSAQFVMALNNARHDGRLPADAITIRTLHTDALTETTPQSVTLTFEYRLVRGESREDALVKIRRILAAAFARLSKDIQPKIEHSLVTPDRGNPYLFPGLTSPDDPFVELTAQSVYTITGGMPEIWHNPYGVPGMIETEMPEQAASVPTVILSAYGADNRSRKEWVSEKSVCELMAVYREVINHFQL
jgi:succinyl-diaminopimelate desuccinylase